MDVEKCQYTLILLTGLKMSVKMSTSLEINNSPTVYGVCFESLTTFQTGNLILYQVFYQAQVT